MREMCPLLVNNRADFAVLHAFMQSVTISVASKAKSGVQANYSFQTMSKVRFEGTDGGCLPPPTEELGPLPVPRYIEFPLSKVLDRAGIPVNVQEIRNIALGSPPSGSKGDQPIIVGQAAMRDMKLVSNTCYLMCTLDSDLVVL